MASCLAIRSLVVWQVCIFFIPLQRCDASYNQRSIAAEFSTSRTHTHTHTNTNTNTHTHAHARDVKTNDEFVWQHWLSNLENVCTCTCNLLSSNSYRAEATKTLQHVLALFHRRRLVGEAFRGLCAEGCTMRGCRSSPVEVVDHLVEFEPRQRD